MSGRTVVIGGAAVQLPGGSRHCHNHKMRRVAATLIQYGQPSSRPALEWAWVDEQLRTAGTYWVSGGAGTPPHPRPVWGVWLDDILHLSVGSPTLAALPSACPVAVHLESGTDVVIVDGVIEERTSDAAIIAVYDGKYSWTYDLDVYGPLISVRPRKVLAWRAAGPAGRDGFTATGRWRWEP